MNFPIMDLLAILLTLQPVEQPDPANQIPVWWGKAAHALILSILCQSNPKLAQVIHDGHGLRPFTVSSLIGHFPRRKLNVEGKYNLRFTALQKDIALNLWEATQASGPLSPGAVIELDGIFFRVEEVKTQAYEHHWAASTTYDELAGRSLLTNGSPARQISFNLISPTFFSSNFRKNSKERELAFPTPEMVFGSLLNKWNTFSSIAFPTNLKIFVETSMVINRFGLSSRRIPVSGGIHVGAVGRITYTILDEDLYWMNLVDALANFAFYAGVGAKSTMGLGQCRRVSPRS